MELTAKILAQITDGDYLADFKVSNFVIDSRNVQSNDCFLALRGEKNDGHNFIQDVIAKNAGGIIVAKSYFDEHNLAQQQFKNYVIVKDTNLALEQIAKYVRGQYKQPIVGITGSSGKTTLKEMIAFVLENSIDDKFLSKNQIAKTFGNFNNHIGMPLCLANLSLDANSGVFEMGMSAKAEISYLTNILKPNIGIITTISSAHNEYFKSELEIAEAKIELIDGMDSSSTLILNMDDKYCDLFTSMAKQKGITKILYFSAKNPKADIYLSNYQLNFVDASNYGASINASILAEDLNFNLKSIAPHNYMLFCVAIAVAKILNFNTKLIEDFSAMFELPKGRGKISWVEYDSKKIMLFDDSYNANPLSMAVAIENLAPINYPKILVLGEMLELGNIAIIEHQKLVESIDKIQYKAIACVGEMMKHFVNNLQNSNNMVKYFDNIADLEVYLLSIIQNGDVLFVKGSYSSWVHKIVDVLNGKK